MRRAAAAVQRLDERLGISHPFPPHDPDFPDVDPRTGDERETTDVNG